MCLIMNVSGEFQCVSRGSMGSEGILWGFQTVSGVLQGISSAAQEISGAFEGAFGILWGRQRVSGMSRRSQSFSGGLR